MPQFLEMQMGGIAGFDELLDVGVLFGRALVYDGDAGFRLQDDLLRIFALVADEVLRRVLWRVNLSHELGAAFLVEFDVLLIGQ